MTKRKQMKLAKKVNTKGVRTTHPDKPLYDADMDWWLDDVYYVAANKSYKSLLLLGGQDYSLKKSVSCSGEIDTEKNDWNYFGNFENKE
jgi:hypothetical protein